MNKIEKDFCGFMAEASASFGLDSLSAKIVALLYLSPEEISMEEIAKKTGFSLPSISNKMKMLEAAGFAQRIRKPGTKKAYFYMEKEMLRVIKKHLQMRYQKVLLPAKAAVPRMLDASRRRKLTEREKKQVEILQNYYKQILIGEKMLQKFFEATGGA
ncbi:hypothetical protein COU37_04150 [Candidatus Micrarchaeota archaeon CG10_big_fil_rev_8_21_14_0_10_45_29]|nr:MAG: hypothetical protein COU37_04150 [Candidatus Micrarchaeota archaeon CG10_big_fil_rev_8_21_14_0_10_45_29]